jgi:transcriptional regulator with XRE-family HTH domain
MNLYEKVKEIVQEKGTTISAIEVKAGVANGTISGWRVGKPYAETLKKVADALEVSIEELL